MQSTPGLHADGAVLGIRRRPRRRGNGLGGRIVTDKLGPVPARPTGGQLAGGISVEATSRTQAHQEADRQIGQRQAELDRVIAGVEGEDRGAGFTGQQIHLRQPGADLLRGHDVDVLPREDASDTQGSRPTRTAQRDLRQPGVVPTGHNGLPMRMAVGMVIVAAIRARFGVTARPDTRVDRKPPGLRFYGVRSDQPFEPHQVHGSGVESIVETAPPTLAVRCQTQVRWRFQDRCAQHGVEGLEQGVAPTPKQRVHLIAEGSEHFHFWRVHIQKDALSSSFCLLYLGRLAAAG